ncbi:hypothetical protein RI367_006400 [Sorochytrium milnesiophthora]
MPKLSNYNWSTVVVTGGGGGLGRVMAESFMRKGKKVIIAGRTEKTLKETCAANPGMEYVVVDTGNLASLPGFVKSLLEKHPDVDCLVNNAGVQAIIDYLDSDQSEQAAAERAKVATDEININVTGVVQLTTLMLPHLLKKPQNGGGAAVMFVSSGLAYVPKADVPVYCATKAFIHSYALSLRAQLQGMTPGAASAASKLGAHPVRVIEIAPPLVASNLHRDHPNAGDYDKSKMPYMLSQEQFLAEFEQAMEEGRDEVAQGMAKDRTAEWNKTFGAGFRGLNDIKEDA